VIGMAMLNHCRLARDSGAPASLWQRQVGIFLGSHALSLSVG
jgi:hypothetical protein